MTILYAFADLSSFLEINKKNKAISSMHYYFIKNLLNALLFYSKFAECIIFLFKICIMH